MKLIYKKYKWIQVISLFGEIIPINLIIKQ